MKAIKGFSELLTEGRRKEAAGEWEAAATAYQKIIDQDAANPQAVSRLLIVYRKMKDYRRELAVIDGALAAYGEQEKMAQSKWLAAHPQAARASKAVLRNLGRAGAFALGEDAKVAALKKRREFVEGRVGEKKKGATAKKQAGSAGRAAAKVKRPAGEEKRAAEQAKKQAAEALAATKAEKAAARKKASEDRKAEAAAKKQAAEQEKKQAAQASAAAKAKKAAKQYQTLFIITLRYLVYPDKLAAATPDHDAFLGKYYKTGNFLASGIQNPAIGETIIATAKNRTTIERIAAADPYLKKKWATMEIMEFSAANLGKGWKNLM